MLEPEDADTDTECYKWSSLSPHGPADPSVTFLTKSLMCKTHLKGRTGHHSFKITVWQPRMSAKFVLPRMLQQGEWLCTITPMHPGGGIDVSRGGNQATTPKRKPGQRTRKPTPESFPENFRNSRGKNFQNFRLAPPKPQKEAYFSKNSRNLRDKNFKNFSFSKFLQQKFQKFKIFGLRFFCVFFVRDGPSPTSKFLCGFQKVSEPFRLLQHPGENQFCRHSGNLGCQTVILNE